MVGYLYLFISALMRETSESRPHSTSSSSQYVLNAIKYIQFNYSHDISIDDVAKSVGVSRSHRYRQPDADVELRNDTPDRRCCLDRQRRLRSDNCADRFDPRLVRCLYLD